MNKCHSIPKISTTIKLLTTISIIALGYLFYGLNLEKVSAQAPSTINFQGKIVNSADGTNLRAGSPACVVGGADTCDFRLSIYDASSGGTLLWQETHSDKELGDYDGVFSFALNSVCNDWPGGCAGSGINWGDGTSLYLQIEFDKDGDGNFGTGSPETFSRKLLNTVPFSYYADNAGQLDGIDSTGFVKLGPTSTQSYTGSNALIDLNESGGSSPNLLQLAVGGSPRFVIDNYGGITTNYLRTISAEGAQGHTLNVTFNGDTDSSVYGFYSNVDFNINDQSSGGGAVGNYLYTQLDITGGSSTMDTVDGIAATVGISGSTSTLSAATGIKTFVFVSGGTTITTAMGIQIQSNSSGGPTGIITNNYGLYVSDQITGTNDYGVYIAGADTYALFVDADTSRFDGNIQLGSDANNAFALGTTGSGGTSDLYFGNDLLCDVSETNCGWVTPGTNLWIDGGTFTYLASTSDDIVIGGNSVATADILLNDDGGATINNQQTDLGSFTVKGETNTLLFKVNVADEGQVSVGAVGVSNTLFNIDRPNLSTNAEKRTIVSNGTELTLTGNYGTQYFNVFSNSVLFASSSQTVTTSATIYVEGATATTGSASVTNNYAILIDGGTSRFDGDAIVGGSTSISETLSNAGFTLGGDDLFVAGTAGIEGDVYTDGSFIAGATLTLNDGFIRDSSDLNLQPDADSDDYFYLDTSSNISSIFWESTSIATNDAGLRLNTSTTKLEYRDENSSSWVSLDSLASQVWTDGGAYVYPTNGEYIGNQATSPTNKIGQIFMADNGAINMSQDNSKYFYYSTAQSRVQFEFPVSFFNGDLQTSGDFTITQATPSIFFTDSDGDDYSEDVNGNQYSITNTTDSRVELLFSGGGGIDFGDNTATKTIDIGGVTSSAADTINIATNGSAADIISIGNNHASTQLDIRGGGEWNIGSNGDANLSNIFSDGSYQLTSAAPLITMVDNTASEDDYSFNVNTNIFSIRNDTDARVEILFSGSGSIDLGDNISTKTIDIGGVTSSATDTINIATNSTLADVITIGNSNGSTTLSLISGSWNINTSGTFTTSGSIDTAIPAGSVVFASSTGVLTNNTNFFFDNTNNDLLLGGTTAGTADIFLGDDGSTIFNEQGNSVNFRIETASDSNIFHTNSTNNNVTIGTTSSANYKFKVNSSISSVTNYDVINVDGTVTSLGAATFRGMNLTVRSTATSGTQSGINGLDFTVRNDGSGGTGGTVTLMQGISTWGVVGTGATVSTLRNINVASPSNSGTLTNNYGIYINAMTAGSKDFGVYVVSADNYAFWADDGVSRFDGGVLISSTGSDTTTPGQELEVDGDIRLDSTQASLSTNGLCHTGANVNNATFTDRDIVACNLAASDIAEWYVGSSNLAAGDIVSLGSSQLNYIAEGADPFTGLVYELGSQTINVLQKATSSDQLIGVISTAPWKTFGNDVKRAVESSGNSSIKPVPLGLKGRIPVNIAPDSDNINPGDPITISSSYPGKGMKATGKSQIVGRALENWTAASGKTQVLLYIMDGDYDPNTGGTGITWDQFELQNGDKLFELNDSGSSSVLTINSTELVVAGSLTINGNITIAGLATTLNLKVTDDVEFAQNAGKVTLPAGDTQIQVANTNTKSTSSINVTPQGEFVNYRIVNVQAGVGFTIEIDTASINNISFSYLIVN